VALIASEEDCISVAAEDTWLTTWPTEASKASAIAAMAWRFSFSARRDFPRFRPRASLLDGVVLEHLDGRRHFPHLVTTPAGRHLDFHIAAARRLMAWVMTRAVG